MIAVFLLATFLVQVGSPPDARGQEKEEFKLWPDGLPAGSVVMDPEKVKELKAKEAADPRGRKLYVDSPTLTVYPAPEADSNGCAVVICPGGSYNALSWQKEGVEMAEWFNSIGVTAFILKYRVPRRIPDKIHWEPMQDVQRHARDDAAPPGRRSQSHGCQVPGLDMKLTGVEEARVVKDIIA